MGARDCLRAAGLARYTFRKPYRNFVTSLRSNTSNISSDRCPVADLLQAGRALTHRNSATVLDFPGN